MRLERQITGTLIWKYETERIEELEIFLKSKQGDFEILALKESFSDLEPDSKLTLRTLSLRIRLRTSV